ncbi:uncharacterized protein SRS1_10433 [Sporisorium reilianum f. sp. reilianum]|uniref:Mig1 protein n=1 Tax=Sporisorium reilianum f. sp. reilianum TaxID=72559 RepID=A0A2N8U9I0_9BASI|nr:uncharacterized protein SRS1_10433 [Sporisorium reilianum f. sp. reilianum]
MKLKTALLPLAMAVAMAGGVAADWLEPTADRNYETYCDPKGAEYNKLHACFVADPAYIKNLEFFGKSLFQGYLSRDQKKFVLLENDQNSKSLSLLLTKQYSIAVKTWQVINPIDKPAEKCVFVRISNAGHPDEVRLRQNFCGLDPISLPDMLWR